MTKERLEEIRHRKYAEDRIVYTVFEGDEKATALHIVYDNELFVAYMMLERVYETKEEAEWYAKTYAERIERFQPPMWKDIKEYYQFCWVNESFDLFYFEVTDDRDTILVGKVNGKNLFEGKATKENYEKACEIVRDLFKEEK